MLMECKRMSKVPINLAAEGFLVIGTNLCLIATANFGRLELHKHSVRKSKLTLY